MNTVIFRTMAPFLTSLMVLFSVFVLLRGHNEPGGGFTGGLVAASAFAIYGIACGANEVRRAFYFHPMAISGFGLLLAAMSGLLSVFYDVPFLTGIWTSLQRFRARDRAFDRDVLRLRRLLRRRGLDHVNCLGARR